MKNINRMKRVAGALLAALAVSVSVQPLNAYAVEIDEGMVPDMVTTVEPGVTSEITFERDEEGTVQVAGLGESADATILYISSYSITNDGIVPGEDFTLSFTVSNSSKFYTAKEVLVNIDSPEGVAPVYGTVGQLFLGDIKPGTSKEVSMDFNSFTSITGDVLKFYIAIVGNQRSNSIELRIPVGANMPYGLLSVNFPKEMIIGQNSNASVTFKGKGKENMQNVTLSLLVDDVEVESVAVEPISQNETRTLPIGFQIDVPGSYNLKMVLKYTNEFGAEMVKEVASREMIVQETSTTPQNPTTMKNDNTVGRILMIGSIVAILALFVVLAKTIKKKY